MLRSTTGARLGDVEARGGTADMELFSDGQEIVEDTRVEVDRARLSLAWETGLGQNRPARLSSAASASFGDKGG
jgi:hypothetical protein